MKPRILSLAFLVLLSIPGLAEYFPQVFISPDSRRMLMDTWSDVNGHVTVLYDVEQGKKIALIPNYICNDEFPFTADSKMFLIENTIYSAENGDSLFSVRPADFKIHYDSLDFFQSNSCLSADSKYIITHFSIDASTGRNGVKHYLPATNSGWMMVETAHPEKKNFSLQLNCEGMNFTGDPLPLFFADDTAYSLENPKNGTVRVFNIYTGNIKCTLDIHTMFCPECINRPVTSNSRITLQNYIYDIETGKLSDSIPPTEGEPDLAAGSLHQFFLSYDYNPVIIESSGGLTAWDWQQKKMIVYPTRCGGNNEISTDGKMMLIRRAKEIEVVRLPECVPVFKTKTYYRQPLFASEPYEGSEYARLSPDGNFLFYTSGKNNIPHLVNLSTGENRAIKIDW